MELNQIPQNPNNWGNVADLLNENSGKIEAETAKLSNATTKFKGYFTTSTALSAKWPPPLVGDTAWVGATYPGVVYRCNVAGAWLATTDVPPSNTVNLSEYATQDAVSNEFASVRSDLSKLEDRTSVLELEIGGGNNYTEGFYIDRTGNYVANENYSYSRRIYVTADDLSKGLYWYYGEYLNAYASLILLAGNEVINFYGMAKGGRFRNLSPSQLESSIQGGVDNIIISFKTSTGGILRTASDNKDLYVSEIKEGLKDGFNILEASVEKVDREVFGVVASSEPTSETKLNMINLEVKAGDKIRMKVNATNGWNRIIFLGNGSTDRLIDSLDIQIKNNEYIEYTATKDIHDFGLYISYSSETSIILTVEAIKGLVEKVKETAGEAFVYIHPSDTQIEIYEKMLGAVTEGNKTVIFEQGNYFFDENLVNYIKEKFPSRTTGFELPIGNDCKYFFNNSVLECGNGSVDNDDWSGTNVLGCRWCTPGFELHDGVIIARDIRYCIHDDPYTVSEGYINKYINMHCIYEGGTRAASGYIYKPIGGGSGRIGMAVFDGCVIEKNNHFDSKVLTYHGTSYEWNTENRFRLSIQNSWIGGDIGIYRTPENPDEILELIVCGSTYKSDISDSLSVDKKWNNTIIS